MSSLFEEDPFEPDQDEYDDEDYDDEYDDEDEYDDDYEEEEALQPYDTHVTNLHDGKDIMGIKLKTGLKVKIVGNGKITHETYTMSESMKIIIKKGDVHKVTNVRGAAITLDCGYTWHCKDLMVLVDSCTKQIKKEKFDINNLVI